MEKKPKRIGFQFLLALLFVLCGLLLTSCSSSDSGGKDDDEEGMFSGGGGTGENNAVTFWRYYGTLGAGEYGGNHSVDVAADGGFFAVGSKAPDFSEENQDYFLLKTDSQGNERWRLTGADPEGQKLNDIRQTADGGAIAVGHTGGGRARDAFAVKTDANGNLQWVKTYDAGASDFDEAHAVCVLSDGYAIAGGGRNHDFWFFRIDADGNKMDGSDRFFSYAANSIAHAMTAVHGGGFVLTGIGQPGGVLFAIRLDENGDEIWRGAYGPGIGYAVCPLPGPGSGYVLVGATPPYTVEASDVLVVKIDDAGNELWRKVFGGADMDIGYGVAAYPSGEFVVAGVTRSFSVSEQWGKEDVYLLKMDQDGELLWQKVKGLSPDNSELAYDVAVTSDGGFVIAASAQAMNVLAKFDVNGETIVLGDMDFTYTVPAVTGRINMANARDIAAISGEFIFLSVQIASFPMDLFIDTLQGMPVSDLCSAGGGYEWSSSPAKPVAAGDSYVLTINDCQSGPADDPSTYNGTFTMIVEEASGDITTDDYEIKIAVNPIDFIFSDDVGETAYSGGLTFSRISTGGKFAERVETAGRNLTFSEAGITNTLTRLDINANRTPALRFSIGNAGQYAILDAQIIPGPVTVTVELPLSGAEMDAPEAGRLLVEAQDGSALTMTFDQGDVEIRVDTDADGESDGEIRLEWMDIN